MEVISVGKIRGLRFSVRVEGLAFAGNINSTLMLEKRRQGL